MRFRKLRMAWSVGCAAATMSLIVLWTRSFWSSDSVGIGKYYSGYKLKSYDRRLMFTKYNNRYGYDHKVYWELAVEPEADRFFSSKTTGIVWSDDGWQQTIAIPHLFLAATLATLGMLPWMRWSLRFSLRTLLIATTLVAVVLGVIE